MGCHPFARSLVMLVYSTSSDAIDWVALKSDLARDRFDNGRTPDQMARSFRASFRCAYARDGPRFVGTARALSDGVCNAYVLDMWTHSAYRRRGIGRRLLELLCEALVGQQSGTPSLISAGAAMTAQMM